ncbi:PREDICTED: protein FAM162A isoform X1 [Haliaeetus leucocephalus]|uniref:protein FAM162A isoform X1 n=1 Tax=Haliaeetus leucocephalus TaxID=52644 RepID=UPI00053CD502|nr:PREDICTED: protein FAM162A isoform X1 [Haliaeetus leucocephalus]
MWGRADRAVKLLGRNIPSILRMTKGVDPKISRRLCIKPQEQSQLQPRSRSPLRVPGHKPTDWEKRFLLWAGHFKKPEDIPETVSIETIRAAKTTLRVKISYVMIALTILGCIVMVIKGKQVSTDFWLVSANQSSHELLSSSYGLLVLFCFGFGWVFFPFYH